MAQQLKRWESPRRKGRNDKGRGGSARQRQLRKQFKTLKKKLNQEDKSGGRESSSLPSLFVTLPRENNQKFVSNPVKQLSCKTQLSFVLAALQRAQTIVGCFNQT